MQVPTEVRGHVTHGDGVAQHRSERVAHPEPPAAVRLGPAPTSGDASRRARVRAAPPPASAPVPITPSKALRSGTPRRNVARSVTCLTSPSQLWRRRRQHSPQGQSCRCTAAGPLFFIARTPRWPSHRTTTAKHMPVPLSRLVWPRRRQKGLPRRCDQRARRFNEVRSPLCVSLVSQAVIFCLYLHCLCGPAGHGLCTRSFLCRALELPPAAPRLRFVDPTQGAA